MKQQEDSEMVCSREHKPFHRSAAFSLLELIVVVAVIGLLFTALSPLFFTYFQSWTKGTRYNEVYQNTREAFDEITRKLREAQSIVSLTTTGSLQAVSYKDANGNTQTFSRFSSGPPLNDFAVGWNNVPLIYPVTRFTITAYRYGVTGSVATNNVNEVGAIRIQMTVTDTENQITSPLTLESQVKLAAYDSSATGYNVWPYYRRNPSGTAYTTQTILDPNATGETLVQKWSYTTGDDIVTCSPIVQSGLVLIGSNDQYLYAFPAQDAATYTWQFRPALNPAEIQSTPVALNNRVYFGTTNGRIHCLNMANGSPIWSPPFVVEGQSFNAHLVAANNQLYATNTGQDRLYTINVSTRVLQWTFNPSGVSGTMSSPAVVSNGSNTFIYVTKRNILFKLRDDSSREVWVPRVPPLESANNQSNPVVVYHPGLSKYIIYVGDNQRRLYSIQDEGTTAVTRWIYQIPGPGRGSGNLYSPIVTYDHTLEKFIIIIARKNGTLYALRDNDSSPPTPLWSYNMGGDPSGTPVIANGVVYAVSTSGQLAAIRLSDGTLLFSTDTGSDNFTSVSVGHNLLYVGSDQGRIYAFGKP